MPFQRLAQLTQGFGISMDAFFRGILIVGSFASIGAGYRTPNFVVQAPTAEFAKQVGDAAEVYRRELAIEWTGEPLPGDWSYPCPITVIVGNMGAGGKTTFNFQGKKVYGWKMEIRGSEQRILDSVLPHEINHTIFASVFCRPLPRWADEGAASLIEHESERNQLRQIHNRAISSKRKIPLKTLLDIKQYPEDQQEVLTLYAEGHSLADFLIQRGDKPRYLHLMQMAYERDWETALKQLYGFSSIEKLEREWDQWVMAGSPKLSIPDGSQVASRDRVKTPETTIRGQSPARGQPSAADVELGEPIRLTQAEPPLDRKRTEPRPENRGAHPGSQDADELELAQLPIRRSRNGLREPLLTVDRLTTDAAKVSKD